MLPGTTMTCDDFAALCERLVPLGATTVYAGGFSAVFDAARAVPVVEPGPPGRLIEAPQPSRLQRRAAAIEKATAHPDGIHALTAEELACLTDHDVRVLQDEDFVP